VRWAIALAVVAAGCYGLVEAFASSGQSEVVWRGGRFVDSRFGWMIRVPKGMLVGHFQSGGMDANDGVRVTNFSPDLSDGGGTSPSVEWLRGLPADGVALQLWFGERLPTDPPARDSKLPLPRQSFHRAAGWPYVGGLPAPLYRVSFGDGFPLFAAVWFGPRASRTDRNAIWNVVRSLQFPRLREGTVWQDRYYVWGQSSRYPTGSATFFSKSSLPRQGNFSWRSGGYYLIHAPRGFYVIRQNFQHSAPSTQCRVAFSHKAFQFFCPGTALRWDRVGDPLGAHAGSEDWALPLTQATVSDDGHILFAPDFYNSFLLGVKEKLWQRAAAARGAAPSS
jgi:hypothetical protein